MTSLKGDLRSIMGTPFGGVGHAVLIFSRVTRAAFNSDSVVLQLHDRIEMPEEADGKFLIDGLDPGPVRVELEGGTVHNHGWNIDLPDEGTWSLADLVDAQVDWSPAVIGRAEAAAREARDHADRAEAGADRVGTAEQVGVWASEASSSASAAASARSAAQTARNASQSARDAAEGHADRAATSESNAAASESAAKQSEDNAGDFAAVATTAAIEAVDAMERATDLAGGDFATHEYVDQKVASVTLTGTGSPEGKVTASVGTTYTDSAATNGAIRWIKASGTGATGWKVEYGDTGWRRVDTIGIFETALTVGTTDRGAWVRRVGDQVTINLGMTTTAGTDVIGDWTVRGFTAYGYPVGVFSVMRDTQRGIQILFGPGPKATYFLPGSTPAGTRVTGTITYPTNDPWPTSLPGTPA